MKTQNITFFISKFTVAKSHCPLSTNPQGMSNLINSGNERESDIYDCDYGGFSKAPHVVMCIGMSQSRGFSDANLCGWSPRV